MIHNIGGVGRQNEIKDVADGYALNFLIPNGHAIHATPDKIKALTDRLALAKRTVDERDKKVVQGIERLRGAAVRILARANDAGGLYKEIAPEMIVAAISSAYGVHVPTQALQIVEPIKKTGPHVIHIKYGAQQAELRVDVAKNG